MSEEPLREWYRALDEARYGDGRILNLRESLPTPDEAVARADAWVRQWQVLGAKELLIITGRGKGSAGGVSPVRVAVVTRLAHLQRAGVVQGVRQHTPGSFVVRLAPFRAPPPGATAEPAPPPIPPPTPATLAQLDAALQAMLRRLAEASLRELGVRDVDRFLEDEMLQQFGILAAQCTDAEDREAALAAAVERELERLEG